MKVFCTCPSLKEQTNQNPVRNLVCNKYSAVPLMQAHHVKYTCLFLKSQSTESKVDF